MGNINNYNFNKYDLIISKNEYYDLTLNTKYLNDCNNNFTDIDHPCLISHFDFNNQNIFLSGNTSNIKNIYSLRIYDKAINPGISIGTYGLTGLDNGVLTYTKDLINDPNNENLSEVLLNSTLNIDENDFRLFLTNVSGYTNNYNYDLEFVETNSPQGNYMNFKGGFYQGYYKLDGYNYQTLPSRYSNGYTIETWLKKDDSIMSEYTGSTLNNSFPNNKGFFLYFGTRAENKFWNQFSGNTTGDCSGSSTNFCTIIKENDVYLTLDNDFIVPLLPPAIEFKEISNGFLLYGRGQDKRCDSGRPYDGLGIYTPCDFSGDTTPSVIISGYTQSNFNSTNQFLIYGRGSGRRCDSGRPYDGYGLETVCSYSGESGSLLTSLDVNSDIIDNALGFRIKDDGSIGYRLLSVTGSCDNGISVTGTTIKEEYTVSGLVTNGKWTNISIRWVPDNFITDCELEINEARNGKLMIYVDCFLKHVFRGFPEFIGRRLNELKEKQVGVPFNISLGGGSQGLLESLTFDGQDEQDLGLLIEQNFAGSFIGSISQFKLYNCNMDYSFINQQCYINGNLVRYNLDQNCYLLDEFGNFILQEDGISKIILEDC